jgi:hypothetical protein
LPLEGCASICRGFPAYPLIFTDLFDLIFGGGWLGVQTQLRQALLLVGV